METLSPEHRAVLELYKKERPDLFARLPLPKKLAEEYGVPIKTDTVHLKDFMRNHMLIVTGHYDEFEEKVACKVTDASGNEIVGKPKPSDFIEQMKHNDNIRTTRKEQNANNIKARSEFYKIQPEESVDERSERWIQEIQSESPVSLQSEPTLNIMERSTNAATIPK